MKLEIESGGRRWQVGLPQGSLFFKVGSAPDCEVVVADASALHAKIENFMGRWTVTDQMSDTGTKVNGETAYSTELKPGDEIEIGSAKIRVMQGEAAPAPKVSPFVHTPPVPMVPPPGLTFKTESLQEMIGKAEPEPRPLSPAEFEAAFKRERPAKPEPVTLRPATPQEFQSALQLEGRATVSSAQTQPQQRQSERQKTPQELFAEEMAARPQAPVYALRRAFTPAQKKGSPVVGFVIMGAVVLCIVGVIIQSVMEEVSRDTSYDDPKCWAGSQTPTPANPLRPRDATSEKPKANTRLSSAEEKQYRTRIQSISAAEEAWEERLAKLDALSAELEGKQHGLTWDFERARRNLETGLRNEMSKRSNRDQTEVYDLVEKHKQFDDALVRLESLKAYGVKTKYHEKLSESAGIKGYVDEKIVEVTAQNEVWLADMFLEVDRWLTLRDYASAEVNLQMVLGKARLPETLKACAKLELDRHKQFAGEQQAGTREAPLPPFDKRKWKLPPAPKSKLLADGDNSRWRFINPLNTRLNKAARGAQLKGTATVLYGRKAVVGEPDSYRIVLTYTRAMQDAAGTDQEFKFVVKRQVGELPASTLLALYEQFEQPTRDEFLGMLLFCFENALTDDAPRLACKLWKADLGVKEDLDKLLAAKLGIEVPPGGFIERDGRLVEK